MKLNAYSIYDEKVLAFNRPYYAETHGAALRAFGEECNRADSMAQKHPEDFRMYHVGAFDQETGVFECLATPPQLLGSATEYVKRLTPNVVEKGLNEAGKHYVNSK